MNDMIVSLKSPKNPAPPAPPPPFEPPRAEPRRRRRKFPIATIISVLLLAALGAGVYFYFFHASSEGRSTERSKETAEAMHDAEIEAEVNDIVGKVGELIVLPSGEVPTVATVSDPEKLRDQAFFENAKVGNKVLIYTKARKAYLYDPKAHKLLEVAPLSVGTE